MGHLSRALRSVSLIIAIGLLHSGATAQPPDYNTITDPLNGRYQIDTVDDLIMTPFRSTGPYDASNNWFFTENDAVTSQGSNSIVASGSCGVPFPTKVRAARLFRQLHDVLVTLTVNSSTSDCATADPVLELQVKDFVDSSNDFTQAVATTPAFGPTWVNMVVADFDFDGYEDIFVMNDTMMFVVTATDVADPSKGLSFTTPIVYTTTGTEPHQNLAVGDLNDDGALDVAWQDALTGTVNIATVCGLQTERGACINDDGFKIITTPLSYEPFVAVGTGECSTPQPAALHVGTFEPGAAAPGLLVTTVTSSGGCHLETNRYTFDADLNATHQQALELPGSATGLSAENSAWNLFAETTRFDWFGDSDDAVIGMNFAGNFPSFNCFDSGFNIYVVTWDGNANQLKAVLNSISNPNTDFRVLYGMAVGRFTTANSEASDYNPSVAIIFSDAAGPGFTCHPPPSSPALQFYSVDPETFVLTQAYSTTATGWLNLAWAGLQFEPQPIGRSGGYLHAGDLQGRSTLVGPPFVLRISQHTQPQLVVGAPPTMVDFVETPGDSAQLVNFSGLPNTFFTVFELSASSTISSETQKTTGYTNATGESVGAFGRAPFIKGSVTASWQQSYAQTQTDINSRYESKSLTVDTQTEGADNVWFSVTDHNLYYYPVIGLTTCPENDPPPCDDATPAFVVLSGPDNTEWVTGDASSLEWYQPAYSPWQVFSYPWDSFELARRVPNLDVLTDAPAYFTDEEVVNETVQWTRGTGTDQSSGSATGHSFGVDASLSVGYNLLDPRAAGGGVTGGFSYSRSSSVSTTITTKTQVQESEGVTVAKPGTFKNPALYKYPVGPAIYGESLPEGTLQSISFDTTFSTTGTMQTLFTANPAATGPAGAGSWWSTSPYAENIDVGLLHPARVCFEVSRDDSPNCLWETTNNINENCFSVYKPIEGQLWNSQFYYMRGLTIQLDGPIGPQALQAVDGQEVYLTARVHNLSLATMDSDTEVHVQFYRQPWGSNNQPAGDSVLIAEEMTGPIPAFGNNNASNFADVTTSFSTKGLAGVTGSDWIFWVLVWAEKDNELVPELLGHGLCPGEPGACGTTPPGTLKSITDAPLEIVTFTENSKQTTQSFSNNAGFFHAVFHVVPATPGTEELTGELVFMSDLDVPELSDPSTCDQPQPYTLGITLGSRGGAQSGASVFFYERDEQGNRRLVDHEMVPRFSSGKSREVRVPYKPTPCGIHDIEIVVTGRDGSMTQTRAVTVPCRGLAKDATGQARFGRKWYQSDRVRIRSDFDLETPVDLAHSKLRIESVLKTAEGELVADLPKRRLRPVRGATTDKARFTYERDPYRSRSLLSWLLWWFGFGNDLDVNALITVHSERETIQLDLEVTGHVDPPESCVGHPSKVLVETILELDDGEGPPQRLTLEEPWRCGSNSRRVTALSMDRELPRNLQPQQLE